MRENEQKELTSQKKLTVMRAIGISTQFGFVIAIPLVIFSLLGKWLNKKYGVYYFLPAGLLLALIISTVSLYFQINRIKKDLM